MTTTENINAQRRATYGIYSGPIASESTAAWIEHTRSTPMGTPYPGARQAFLLIHQATGNAIGYGVQVGSIRGVEPNTDTTTNSLYPWKVCDHPHVLANGFIVNDYVSVGDTVWAPGRGQFNIHNVRVQGGYIDTVTARGSVVPVNTWFRVNPHSITERAATPNRPSVAPGDLVVVEDSDSAAALGRIMRVVNDYGTSITVEPVGADSAIHVARSWIVVFKNGSVQEGALVRPLQFLEGATTEYQEWARQRTFVASGTRVHPSTIRVRAEEAFSTTLPAGHETSLRAWEIVGHTDSRHAPFVGEQGEAKAPEAPASEDDALADMRAQRDKAVKDLADLWEALHQEARSRGWCSEFDDFAHNNGGPERSKGYEVIVDLEYNIDPHSLDRVLGPLLCDQMRTPDVQESVTVTNRVTVSSEMTTSEAEDRTSMADRVEPVLTEQGYKFDSFEIVDWHEE